MTKQTQSGGLLLATFAGGCFWCMEPVFRIYPGVKSAMVGYAGEGKTQPSYEEVSGGNTSFKEAIQITYNTDEIEYTFLLKIFLHNIDPTDAGGQFYDRGSQYQTAIYYHNDEQKSLAETALQELTKMKKFTQPLAVQILPYQNFFSAEEYHQEYYKKNPVRYGLYHKGSGRDEFIKKTWPKG